MLLQINSQLIDSQNTIVVWIIDYLKNILTEFLLCEGKFLHQLSGDKGSQFEGQMTLLFALSQGINWLNREIKEIVQFLILDFAKAFNHITSNSSNTTTLEQVNVSLEILECYSACEDGASGLLDGEVG